MSVAQVISGQKTLTTHNHTMAQAIVVQDLDGNNKYSSCEIEYTVSLE